jgi:hypothetical protein
MGLKVNSLQSAVGSPQLAVRSRHSVVNKLSNGDWRLKTADQFKIRYI